MSTSPIQFIAGAIPPEKIAQCISEMESYLHVGAHDIFLGQVRADEIDGKLVEGIDYSAYEEMAIQAFEQIIQEGIERYDLQKVRILHSLGKVKVGELCLFVLAASAHRKAAIEGCTYLVERLKKEVPIFGKEIFQDESYQWKVNQ